MGDVIYIWGKWLLFIIAEKLMDVVNLFTAPIVVLLADDDGWLPAKLSWWQTPDNSIDGDLLWQTERRPFKENTGVYQYINRVAWLYRNSMYGFAIDVVGLKKTPYHTLYTNFNLSDGPWGKPYDYDHGLLTWRLIDGYGRLIGFQIFYIYPYPWSDTKSLRINIGWKLWAWDDPKWKACQCVLSFNPWKSYPDR